MEAFKERINSIRKSLKRPQKMDSIRALTDEKDFLDGLVYENPTAHNLFNTAEELYNILSSRTCADETSGSESNSEEHVPLLEPQDFPEPPEDLDQSLNEHLITAEDIVLSELERFRYSGSRENLKNLIDRCHQRTFSHLHALLQNVETSKNCFLLMTWVKQSYLCQEQLSDPDQVLLTEWDHKAQQKLIPRVQEEISEFLYKVLQLNGSQTQKIDDAETYVGLYVDIIQYTSATTQKARNISPELHDEVHEVCFQELLNFVQSYTEKQVETLGDSVQKWKKKQENVEPIYFLKTLRTCEELRKYVQSKGKIIHLNHDIMSKLKDTKTFILELLMEIISELAERDLKDYFKSKRNQLQLLKDLKTYFPKTTYFKDEQKDVMAQAYEFIAHIYLKHLVGTSQWKLKRWGSDVGLKVGSDTEELQGTLSELAPGVQLGHVMLLSVPEVLKNNDINALKLIFATSQTDCGKNRKDQVLIPDLLRWKGLSRSKVTEVLEALPDEEPKLRSMSRFRKFLRCCFD